jgi:uncharacterized protein (TIGR03083 family)
MDRQYDAIVVGARCAGATLATLLARAGWRVLLVDRDGFPSDTVSTHLMFPDTLQRLDELGVMDRLNATHDIPLLRFSWRVLGHEVAGEFTPMGDYRRMACVRRIVLDEALVRAAANAGAELRLQTEVTGLLGGGTAPIRGVELETGEQISSRWVIGADGRRSTVARRLGLRPSLERRGEMAFLLSYWRGLPPSDWGRIDVRERSALMSAPCEDGLHLFALAGPPEITRGSTQERERRYLEGLRQFPAALNARLLDGAERVSPLVVAPETMMRGHYRAAAGPGWALVGDAGHFKHPATAQGIGDAVQQAWWLAEALVGSGDLSEYEAWRDARAAEHYDWSFELARFGDRRAALYAGLAADPSAGQQFLDLFTKRVRPSDVVTPDRVARWDAASAYEDGLRTVRTLVDDLDPAHLTTVVPACPDWTVRDLLGHLAGVAEDAVGGAYFRGALDAWRDPSLAGARERWTAGHVADRAGWDLEKVLRSLDEQGGRYAAMLRAGERLAGPTWSLSAPVADLAVHVDDLREALHVDAGAGPAVTRLGFRAYRHWLHVRIVQRGLPALRLGDGTREWVLGDGEPAATLTADRHALFRAIAGRRSAREIRSYDWHGDPEPYLSVIAPYPLPPD